MIYDPEYFETTLNQIVRTINALLSPGVVRASKLNLSQLPTSAAGLRSGDIWVDSVTLKKVA